jgi:hypothetical protein
VRQFASDQIKISWLGIPDWETGLAVGTNVQEQRNTPRNFSYKPNGYGGVVPLFNPDLSGALVMTFNRESAEHARLVTFSNLDLGTRSIIAPMLITDKNTQNAVAFNGARLAGRVAYSTGTNSPPAPWVFVFAQAVEQVFGFDNNLVGS